MPRYESNPNYFEALQITEPLSLETIRNFMNVINPEVYTRTGSTFIRAVDPITGEAYFGQEVIYGKYLVAERKSVDDSVVGFSVSSTPLNANPMYRVRA